MHRPIPCCVLLALISSPLIAQDSTPKSSVFAKDNLVVWCIVPFDAKKRGPAARAEMVKQLGLTKVAYDWRAEHVPTFEEEIIEYKKRGIEYFAFWSWHDAIAPLIKRHNIHPQIWNTLPSPPAESQVARVKAAAEQMMPQVRRTADLGLKLGLYNHGGWGGEPQNLVAVCEYLRREHDANHVGIVYNFHHGHGHIDDFAETLRIMKPYLLCLNLNGMADPGSVDTNQHQHKIKPIGTGVHENQMMKTILASGYEGPIGILGHRKELDAQQAVQLNLDGMKKVLQQIGDQLGLQTYQP
ncbi:MAG: TIM barrel protein [Pirellulaceae bacterium]|nr:TIM barrel protein [Pirellulaceae bacterium]